MIKGKLWEYPLSVRGITFRLKDNNDLISDEVIIERESNNPYDSMAIAVYNVNEDNKKKIGYLPRECARKIGDQDLPSCGKIVWKAVPPCLGVKIQI
jgi:hypothetical protein